jgi:hypothetical protein
VAFLKKFEGDAPATTTPLPALVHSRAIPDPAKVVCAKPTGASWDILFLWEGRAPAEATWQDLEDFKQQYPDFKLEDELLWGGGSVMDTFFSRKFERRNKAKKPTPS